MNNGLDSDNSVDELNAVFTVQSAIAMFSGFRLWRKNKLGAVQAALSVVLRPGEAEFVLRMKGKPKQILKIVNKFCVLLFKPKEIAYNKDKQEK